MAEDKLLLSIQASSHTFSSTGYIALYKISEVIYSVRYEDDERCISVDIDCVNSPLDKPKTILFQEPLQQEYSFYVPDETQFALFVKIQKECQDICNHYLEIATRLRDVYYSGVYSNFQNQQQLQQHQTLNQSQSSGSHNPPQMLISQELEGLQAQTAFDFLEALKNGDLNGEGKNGKGGSTTPRSTGSVAGSVKSETSFHSSGGGSGHNKCFYCKNEYQDLSNNELYSHPYVPVKFDGSPVLMCLMCLQNWKEYRDTAQYENELILPGEINEEICCLCSDSPETLTLCASCPRSFCNACLLKILPKKEYTKRIEQSDPNWKCMACTNDIDRQPVLSRDNWRVWKSHRASGGGPKSPKKGAASPRSNPSHKGGDADEDDDDAKMNVGNDDDEEAANGNEREDDDVQTDDQMSVDSNGGGDAAASTSSKRKFDEIADPVQGTTNKLKVIAEVKKELIQQSESYVSDDTTHVQVASSSKTRNAKNDEIIGEGKKNQKGRGKAKSTGGEGSGKVEHVLLGNAAASTKETVHGTKTSGKPSKGAASSTGKAGANSSSKGNAAGGGGAGGAGSQSIECYYFQQYLEYEDNLYTQIHSIINKQSSKGTKDVITDDVCFLCKDGGNVVECDYTTTHQQQSRGQGVIKPFRRCLKVYHEDCLGFTIPDEVEKWCCPRHYCSCCGSDQIKFFCIYCPNSICSKCPETFVQRYGYARYCEVTNDLPDPALKHTPVSSPTLIACESCLDMINQVKAISPSLKLKNVEFGPEKRFPGVFQPGALAAATTQGNSSSTATTHARKKRKH